MKTWRIGVIGLGQRIAHVLAAMAEMGWRLDVAGYADLAPVGLPILEQTGIEAGEAFESVADLLADGPFDLIMIGSPNHLHFEHLRAAFAAGFPIFAEKPIVRTREETVTLARILAEGRAPPLFIGLVMRSMPIVREVLARVDAGELGDIISMDATEHLHPEHGAYLARNWRRRAEWGGSFMLDKVCHDFDIFGRIAGSRARRVASFGGRRSTCSSQLPHPSGLARPRLSCVIARNCSSKHWETLASRATSSRSARVPLSPCSNSSLRAAPNPRASLDLQTTLPAP